SNLASRGGSDLDSYTWSRMQVARSFAALEIFDQQRCLRNAAGGVLGTVLSLGAVRNGNGDRAAVVRDRIGSAFASPREIGRNLSATCHGTKARWFGGRRQGGLSINPHPDPESHSVR